MEQIILFAFLTVFPFGKIVKIGIINPIDIIVGLGAIYAVIKQLPQPKVFSYFKNFLLVAVFSWIVGSLVFARIEVFYGLLYLARLGAYFYFFIFLRQFNRKFLLNSLLAVSVAVAIFGWIQYFIYPDVRALVEYGWDDHLFRMIGTFLDPAFLGLILVFGLTISLNKKLKLMTLFFLTSLAFTYSRASYLAALIPLIYKKSWAFLIVFLGIILFLPRTAGEGVKLERTASVGARFTNYTQTLDIIKKNALLGVGFNNICLAKDADFKSHSCSGADSSILFLLATTGIIEVWKVTGPDFKIFGLTVLAHSLFSNSLFYSFILGFLVILLAVYLQREVKD